MRLFPRLSPSTRRIAGALGSLTLLGLAFMPGCQVGYLLRSGYFQAELLMSREPLDKVRASGALDDAALSRLDLIDDVKAYGSEMGLAATDNYGTLAVGWERQIWNVSACRPLAFESRTWWFPIVGRVPYLGFFREEDARKLESELSAEGWDVYVRTAGAYSTLGWFKDPILPQMLTWSDYNIADTVLHELAHATLWVPGSVKFNESFANFVGEIAAARYLADRRGVHSPALVEAMNRQMDRQIYRDLLHQLYTDLSAVYADKSLDDAAKLAEKRRLFEEELPRRVEESELFEKAKYLRAAKEGPWNNARMIQFKVYNTNDKLFAQLLAQEQGDLLSFIHRVGELTQDQKDPFASIAKALGAAPPTQDELGDP